MADEKHNKAQAAVDKAQDAVGAAVGKTAAATGGGSTSGFAKNAVLSDRYEIKAAEVALSRSRSESVRDFAQQMLDDHTANSRRLDGLLASGTHGIDTPPTELDSRRKGLVENLEKSPEDQFDTNYLDQQVAAHDEATTLFRNYAENGDDAELAAYARDALPVLERHFDNAKALRREM